MAAANLLLRSDGPKRPMPLKSQNLSSGAFDGSRSALCSWPMPETQARFSHWRLVSILSVSFCFEHPSANNPSPQFVIRCKKIFAVLQKREWSRPQSHNRLALNRGGEEKP